MEKEFIPYEQALALKELGFNKRCNTCYDKLQMVSSYGKDVFDYKNYNTSGYVVSRPTFSQVFRWFREKYGLHYRILFGKEKYAYSILDNKGHVYLVRLSLNIEYEEAELECLKKLIEIVKTK